MNHASQLLVVLAVATAAVSSGCHERPMVARVRADATGRHPSAGAAQVAAPGIVEPRDGEVRVAATEPGVLVELLATEGRAVARGELLARLEDSRQRHAVALAESDVVEALAVISGLEPVVEDVRAAEAERAAAQARAEQQAREQGRVEALAVSGSVTAEEAERAAAGLRVERAVLSGAEARLALTERGARPSERRVARARLEAAQLRLADARAALARREVRAPSAGTVLWSRYHAGEFYEPARGPVVVVGDLSRMRVRLEVDDLDAPELAVGARCRIVADDGAALGEAVLSRLAVEHGSRSLVTERPRERSDARVREVFLEVGPAPSLVSGRQVWGYCPRHTVLAAR